MRVPVQPSQLDNSSAAKPPTSTVNTHLPPPNITLGYEPTSVLELRGSPTPATEKPSLTTSDTTTTAAVQSDPSVPEFDEHALRNMDWDSIMRDLGLDDDSALTSFKSGSTNINPQFTHQIQNFLNEFSPYQTHHHNNNNHHHPPPPLDSNTFINQPDFNNFSLSDTSNLNFAHVFDNNSLDFIDELIRASDCVDSNELQLAQMILARLNQRLRSPVGKPLQRAAFFFKEALTSVLSGLTRQTRVSSVSEIVHSLRAYKAFCAISPIPMFTHFTSNQALLESLDRDGISSSPLIHIIDFDIGFGGQYASFMRELADKAESGKINPVSIRITAVVPDEYATETKLIKENLIHFAQDLKIRFHIDFVLVRIFELFSFKAIKFVEGEKTAVVISPAIFRRLGSTNNAVAFASDMRLLSPTVVVFIDSEGSAETSPPAAAAAGGIFKRGFVSSLQHYSMMFESLDAAIGGGDWPRKIEMSILRPRIIAAVEGAGRRVAPWKEILAGAGLRPVKLSQFADFQAEFLLGKVQVGGFHVDRRHSELVLCWHQWVLVATSAWRC